MKRAGAAKEKSAKEKSAKENTHKKSAKVCWRLSQHTFWLIGFVEEVVPSTAQKRWTGWLAKKSIN
jgi:hypothetical protein